MEGWRGGGVEGWAGGRPPCKHGCNLLAKWVEPIVLVVCIPLGHPNFNIMQLDVQQFSAASSAVLDFNLINLRALNVGSRSIILIR